MSTIKDAVPSIKEIVTIHQMLNYVSRGAKVSCLQSNNNHFACYIVA